MPRVSPGVLDMYMHVLCFYNYIVFISFRKPHVIGQNDVSSILKHTIQPRPLSGIIVEHHVLLYIQYIKITKLDYC